MDDVSHSSNSIPKLIPWEIVPKPVVDDKFSPLLSSYICPLIWLVNNDEEDFNVRRPFFTIDLTNERRGEATFGGEFLPFNDGGIAWAGWVIEDFWNLRKRRLGERFNDGLRRDNFDLDLRGSVFWDDKLKLIYFIFYNQK